MNKEIRFISRLKFTGIPNIVIDKYTQVIGLSGLGIYAVLKKFADYESGVCWPGISTIAEICGVSRFTVMRTLSKLVEAGLLQKESPSKFAHANLYTFVLPDVDVAVTQHRSSKSATFDVANLQHANKEERDSYNETHGTRLPPSRAKIAREQENPF